MESLEDISPRMREVNMPEKRDNIERGNVDLERDEKCSR